MRRFALVLIVFSALFVFSRHALFADGEGLSGAVAQKLDEVLRKQSEILSQLAEIKQELYVVKIRSTNR